MTTNTKLREALEKIRELADPFDGKIIHAIADAALALTQHDEEGAVAWAHKIALGYKGGTVVSDFYGAKITLRYNTSADAELAFQLLTDAIDASIATPPAEKASTSIVWDTCGGCGTNDPTKRCIGCAHVFRALSGPGITMYRGDAEKASAESVGRCVDCDGIPNQSCYCTQPAADHAPLDRQSVDQADHAKRAGSIQAAPLSAYSEADQAFYKFWYGHMKNDMMTGALADVRHATARYIWDAAKRGQQAGDALDAARYRWIRDNQGKAENMICLGGPDDLDRAIDAARASAAKGGE